MGNLGACRVEDYAYWLLVKNLPGLTSLSLRNEPSTTEYNHLSDIATGYICQLRQLVELRIGADVLI